MNSLKIRKQVVALVVGLALLVSISVTARTIGIAETESPMAVACIINNGGGC
ncbi:MAG: hypothetical protein AB8G95_05435 [Anaerolineae bacterium]